MPAPLRETHFMNRLLIPACCLCFAISSEYLFAADPTRSEAAAALQKAVMFFDGAVSVEGAYLWRYSDDLSLREGENVATATGLIPTRAGRS